MLLFLLSQVTQETLSVHQSSSAGLHATESVRRARRRVAALSAQGTRSDTTTTANNIFPESYSAWHSLCASVNRAANVSPAYSVDAS